jgi:hypothetical protein
LTPLLVARACSFEQALQQHVTQLGADADALRKAHAKKDDDMGRLVDGVTSQLAAAREGVRAKQDLIRSSEASMERLRSEARASQSKPCCTPAYRNSIPVPCLHACLILALCKGGSRWPSGQQHACSGVFACMAPQLSRWVTLVPEDLRESPCVFQHA